MVPKNLSCLPHGLWHLWLQVSWISSLLPIFEDAGARTPPGIVGEPMRFFIESAFSQGVCLRVVKAGKRIRGNFGSVASIGDVSKLGHQMIPHPRTEYEAGFRAFARHATA